MYLKRFSVKLFFLEKPMTIIKEIERVHNRKIRHIVKIGKDRETKIIRSDLDIINSHKFIMKSTKFETFIIKCKICEMEADITRDTIYCFYNTNGTENKYISCSAAIMYKACV